VDDEQVVREVMTLVLRERGYEVASAGDAQSALAALSEQGFALALVDVSMPVHDGLWFLEHARKARPDTSVVMVTGVGDVQTALECLRRGATDYLIKPVPSDVLTLTVDRALTERRMRLELTQYRERLEETVEEQARRIRDLYAGSMSSLAKTIEAKDLYTAGHSERVADLGVVLARELGLEPELVGSIDLAGRLHDVGKIGIREAVLNKPGALTPEEFTQVKQHPVLGVEILKPIAVDDQLVLGVRHHHENWDGSGYPDGLPRQHIPVPARILRICDIFEALTSNRSYRAARSVEEARDIMMEERGTTTDPEILEVFLGLLESGRLPVPAHHGAAAH
jgi:response regulator RpfG family c-di-GMP phosphodiesterase